MYCATDIGLISIQGQIRRSSVGMLSNSFLIGIFLPPLFIALSSIESSEVPCAAVEASGILADSFETSSVIVSSLNFSSASAYFLTVSSNLAPWKPASDGVSCITLMIIP